MSDVPFIDTHVHFWKRPHPILKWYWLEPDFIHPLLGDTQLLKEMKVFTANEFAEEAEGSNVSKIVHIQAAIGTEDPVEETKWLNGMADIKGWPTAIIGDAHLQHADVEKTIERQTHYPRFRGLRDFGEGDYLTDPNFHRGYALLEKYNLVFDMDVHWENMHKAADLAKKQPNITLIIDHAGLPLDRTAEYFYYWRKGMAEFKTLDHVYVKISGLGMGDRIYGREWTLDTIRPWVETCIDIFGVARSFFGTNWPVDKMYSTYAELIGAYRELISGFSHEEKVALCSGNAERVYRI